MGGGLSCLDQVGQAPSWRALPASTTSPGSLAPFARDASPTGGGHATVSSLPVEVSLLSQPTAIWRAGVVPGGVGLLHA